ncbi:glycoside hydrolase family 6 protein [Streptomyces cavernicola]|uniref:Glucanase n=1 Tax=Streptomyces cavernicola TaxID=3043613 RepID=A0ABT6SAY1_9ACTN|nr:glycoside hydrolase family 6 protein [Streptomyces sp. B-S-A6]MDI3404471.1 glycoside hydrolase family 6 protein [Streptomyces sp. B-S-A6]
MPAHTRTDHHRSRLGRRVRLVRRRRLARGGAALAALGLVLGCSPESDDPQTKDAALVRGPSKPSGSQSEFWVDPNSPAARQVAQWRAKGRDSDADMIRRIADQPMAVWPAGDDPGPTIKAATRGAEKANRTAVLVAYNIPHRDCGQHSRGGAASADAYRQWIGAFADNIEDSKALVILEPDAIPHLVDGCTPAEYQEERYQLMSEAIDRLKKQPNVKVYVDAGHSAWIQDRGRLTQALWKAGIDRADGFALNVSNFQTDAATKTYGKDLSKLLNGKHFVMDTGRNGKGPLPGGDEAWCNPPGRALGNRPSTKTGDPVVDAFLWIKRPGESDGECRGGPPAGKWWPEYALNLSRNSG